jgi:hypothetical protein
MGIMSHMAAKKEKHSLTNVKAKIDSSEESSSGNIKILSSIADKVECLNAHLANSSNDIAALINNQPTLLL